jgi:hypothetical protein
VIFRNLVYPFVATEILIVWVKFGIWPLMLSYYDMPIS